jgi:crossover junction endodeoxyribonuclease RuvC
MSLNAKSPTITIMGIDPGYDRVGWAVGQAHGSQIKVLGYGCVETDKTKSLIERYHQIDTQLVEILTTHRPTEAAVESLFFFKNQTTAMHVSEARGVIISCLFRQNVTFAEYTPLQIKQAVTGFGRADKKAVEKMVRLQLGLNEVSSKSEQLLDDTLDALAILITHAASRKLR